MGICRTREALAIDHTRLPALEWDPDRPGWASGRADYHEVWVIVHPQTRAAVRLHGPHPRWALRRRGASKQAGGRHVPAGVDSGHYVDRGSAEE